MRLSIHRKDWPCPVVEIGIAQSAFRQRRNNADSHYGARPGLAVGGCICDQNGDFVVKKYENALSITEPTTAMLTFFSERLKWRIIINKSL